MSHAVKISGVSDTVDIERLRDVFKGLSIPKGAVIIVGGVDGIAYIAFEKVEDRETALSISGRYLERSQIFIEKYDVEGMKRLKNKIKTSSNELSSNEKRHHKSSSCKVKSKKRNRSRSKDHSTRKHKTKKPKIRPRSQSSSDEKSHLTKSESILEQKEVKKEVEIDDLPKSCLSHIANSNDTKLENGPFMASAGQRQVYYDDRTPQVPMAPATPSGRYPKLPQSSASFVETFPALNKPFVPKSPPSGYGYSISFERVPLTFREGNMAKIVYDFIKPRGKMNIRQNSDYQNQQWNSYLVEFEFEDDARLALAKLQQHGFPVKSVNLPIVQHSHPSVNTLQPYPKLPISTDKYVPPNVTAGRGWRPLLPIRGSTVPTRRGITYIPKNTLKESKESEPNKEYKSSTDEFFKPSNTFGKPDHTVIIENVHASATAPEILNLLARSIGADQTLRVQLKRRREDQMNNTTYALFPNREMAEQVTRELNGTLFWNRKLIFKHYIDH